MPTLAYNDLKRARRRAWEKSWREKNKDKVKQRNERWREKNPEYNRIASRKRRANPDVRRGDDLQKRYGLAKAQWDAIFASQGCACAVCKTDNPGGQPWHTDHDHRTDRVRGILCFRCNVALGMLGDDYESVIRSLHLFASYLSPASAPD